MLTALTISLLQRIDYKKDQSCIPPCAVTGQAAGTAAALTDDFNNIDIKTLQKTLEEDGVKLHLD